MWEVVPLRSRDTLVSGLHQSGAEKAVHSLTVYKSLEYRMVERKGDLGICRCR